MNGMGPMVELFPTRRRAEAFARALEGEQATDDPALRALLDTASRLAAIPLAEPRPEFRDSLRSRLTEAAAVELPAPATATAGGDDKTAPSGPTGADDTGAVRRRRRLVALATALVLAGGGTGVAAASEHALPGDMLYPIKRTLESAQVTLAQGAAAEGRALLDRASTRLDEAAALSTDTFADELDLVGIDAALDDFAVDASSGGERLLDSYAAGGDAADLRTLRDFAADSHEVLAELAEALPPESQPTVMAADETVVALDSMAMRACPECTSEPPLPSLPTEPVSLPQLDENASPYVPGTRTLTVRPDKAAGQRHDHGQRQGEGRSANHSPPQRSSTPHDPTPRLPDVGIDAPGPGGQAQGAAPGGSGGEQQPQRRPRIHVGDVLNSPDATSSQAPRTTGELDTRDVTEPLTDPLTPLLDDTGGTLDIP